MNEAAALLDWYYAMGVDEAMEETPQDRFKPAVVEPLAASPRALDSAMRTAPTSSAPPFTAPAAATVATPPAASAELLAETQKLADSASTLEELAESVRSFKGLNICKTATNPVFADGVAGAELMIIGEAPGAQEDRQGIPFCGPSGQLLDKMLAAIGYSRSENCYISNVIFWRPPGNRNPSEEERAICLPFVQKHIALAKPKLILLSGGIAVSTILKESRSISRLRGSLHTFQNPVDAAETPVIVSYHPSYLLRQPLQKKLAWQDMIAVEAQLKK